MTESSEIINTGLRGVPVASTRICLVDGQNAKLIYRGYNIIDLAQNATFEEVVHLLLFEHLPAVDELDYMKQRLAEECAIADEIITALKTRPADASPMDILQACVPMLANHDPEATNLSAEKASDTAIRLIAKFPTIMAAWHRIRNGREPVSPDPSLGHAENFLYMITGNRPDAEVGRFMDVCLVLHAEHAFNASTFSARQVSSSRSHMYAAVAAAVGSLSGELHGGANARVMQMLLEIGSEDAVEQYVESRLNSGGKVMGMGHPVYKTGDPRAAILGPMSKKMGERVNNTKWYELSEAVRKNTQEVFMRLKGTEIYPNVDFYSATVYYAMGIPVDMFTPVFAIARVSGWCAHVIEEQFAGAAPKPVLYRPASEYVGEYCGPEECAFLPMEERQ
ncbi:MAG: citrate (Si)-synthase [Desulfobacterales bacterium]|nr:citrate (Si)-synthase [Desulfobacterales bacterium]